MVLLRCPGSLGCALNIGLLMKYVGGDFQHVAQVVNIRGVCWDPSRLWLAAVWNYANNGSIRSKTSFNERERESESLVRP